MNFKNIYIFVILAFTLAQLNGQSRGRYANQGFLDQQFWIGLRLGSNLSKAKPVERYTLFSSTDGQPANYYDKKYKSMTKPAFEAGIDFVYDYKGFGIYVSPTFTRFRYGYENNYQWNDTADASFRIDQHNVTSQSMDYFRIPLGLRYAPRELKLRPNVTLGIYYGILFAANRITQIEKTDYASGGANTYTPQSSLIGNKNLFIKSNFGWFGSVGVSYPLGNMRASFDVAYWRNTNVLTSRQARFDDQTISNDTDIQDDIKLRNISASISFAIPLRFLSSNNATSE
jgi:hypothetical protein